jgi:hypothetical protein
MIINMVYFFIALGVVAFAILVALNEIFYNDVVKNLHLLAFFSALNLDSLIVAFALWGYEKVTGKEQLY